MLDDAHLLNGLNVHEGFVTYRAVVDALEGELDLNFRSPLEALS
jgi:alanine dehydrogenase